MLDISGKIDRFNLEILKKIKEIADKLNIEFFLIGATVRDLILHCVYNINVYRATNDIDFASSVKNKSFWLSSFNNSDERYEICFFIFDM